MTTRTLTILLADLVGSSAHIASIPQKQAVDYLEDATFPIKEAIVLHGGRITKFTGDGYMAAFESVEQALRAAERIREGFMRQTHTPAGIALDGVRVVVNTTDVTVQPDGDLVGDGVALVSRLEKNVETNQVYVTEAVRQVADDAEFKFQAVGEVRPRGWHRSVMVYQLKTVDMSYTDPSVCLLITDLHGLKRHGEALSASEFHDWLMTWGDLHRRAVEGLNGRVRQFVADMALVTFGNADDSVRALLNLCQLTREYNQGNSQLPPLQFKAAIAHGDLILTPTGIVGQLVNRTFDLLAGIPRAHIAIEEAVFEQLAESAQSRFQPLPVTLRNAETTVYQLVRDPASASGDAPAQTRINQAGQT